MSGKVGTDTTLTHQELVVVVFAVCEKPNLLLLEVIRGIYIPIVRVYSRHEEYCVYFTRSLLW